MILEWLVKLLALIGGIFPIVAAIANWDKFMNDKKAKVWVKLFGRNGARVFYIVLGIAIVYAAIFYL